jgi:3-hydroxyacyl-CoA dehydrogenase/enoyl-CoA hydratase/carnithine racemase
MTTDALTAALPDEVVTRSLVRDVDLPGGAGTLALITLDNGLDHTRPSTFGPRGLRALRDALEAVRARAEAGEIVAVGVTGKPYVFLAGADLGMLKGTSSAGREEALAIGRLGHDALGRLADLPVPSFAYVNGVALGGGVEIALHCTYRTLSSGVPALALPECFLGLVPGWGGAFLLPNLIGPQRALEVIITNPLNQNRMLTGPKAYELGLGDAIFEPADFLARSLIWTSAVLRGEIVVERAPVDRSQESWDAAVAAARALADQKVSGAAPAPYRAIDLVAAARTATREAAFAAEDEALADLARSPQLHAGLYAFDLVQKRARRPAGAPDRALARPVTGVGVVGAGLMASQLALLFLRRLKVPVVMTDLDPARVERGVAYVHAELDKLQRKGRISADGANRLRALVRGSTDKSAFAGCDLVIEAVFEELSVKQAVFAEVEAVVDDTCLLMTNTSSLSVSAMAADLKHPERVVGFHFFNPVAVLPLIEVVRGEQTDEASLATAFAVAKELKKTAVLVRDAPAFVVNRLLTRLMGEVQASVDEGTDPAVADRAISALGLPMPPFVLLQLVGPAIARHVAETLHGHFPARYPLSENLARLVEAGRPGLWSWDGEGKPYLDDETRALLRVGDTPQTGEQVRERALRALAEEAAIMLDEGVVGAPQDLDLCLIMGAGWPFHLGGITPYLDREGISEAVTGRRFLPPGVSTRV